MYNLSHLQKKILAILQEAGSDNVTAVMAHLGEHVGNHGEIEYIRLAIVGLVRNELVQIAREHRTGACDVVSDEEQAIDLLKTLEGLVEWCAVSCRWNPKRDSDWIPIIILTTKGRLLAQRILTEDGWPKRP